jgi:dedicator of cytokinesis protein 3
MVDLEVGDEVYAFERYVPRHGGERNMWLRGYVVSTSRTPAVPSVSADPSSSSSAATASAGTTGKPAEPSIFLGIFPAAFVYVREELDDAEGRLGATWREFEDSRRAEESRYGSGAGRGRAPLEALREDEEDEGELSSTSGADRSGSATALPSGSSSALSRTPREKLPPPIPSLKAGDETAGGAREPLVDEIACALREWHLRLFGYLLRREYALFGRVSDDVAALHLARRQLIEQTLGAEELAAVRRDCVARLVKGNVSQGLDVIVRHPATGGLVTVAEGDADPRGVDTNSFVSGVRMYATQVVSRLYENIFRQKCLAH